MANHLKVVLQTARRSTDHVLKHPSMINATRYYSSRGFQKAAIMFPGQGAQFVGMSQDIYQDFKAASEIIDEAEEAIGGGLRKLMFEGPQSQLTSTENAQPAILAHSIALLRVLETEYGFDVKSCSYALGHSLGEYSALVATRSLPLRDAIKLVRLRGTLMAHSVYSKETAMKALVITAKHLEDVEALMEKIQRSMPEGEVADIANINSRTQVVLSGTAKGVDYASSIFQTKGMAGRSISLPVSAPFHCRLMEPAAAQMAIALAGIDFKLPIIDVISNVTGKPFGSSEEIRELLVTQMTQTVQWQRSVRYAKDDEVDQWIVVGPSRVVSNLVKKEFSHDVVRSFSSAEDLRGFGSRLNS
ncbi:acyl transferase/acyl hydrolase/lysophospholipase [Cladochytrium replicatum]|nr:acyl transferase/acyl hydrolase/lysophospholipase [Cladochytrium replicatum]